MDPETHDIPPDQRAANQLVIELKRLGLRAEVHWDRSPWGAAIPLVDTDEHYETVPTLYVLTEDECDHGHRLWFGAVSFPGSEEVDAALTESTFRWRQYGTFAVLAGDLAVLVELLKHGAIRSHAMLG